MLTTSCTGHLVVVFTMELPTKEGSSHHPSTVIIATPHEVGGSMTCRFISAFNVYRIPRSEIGMNLVVLHSLSELLGLLGVWDILLYLLGIGEVLLGLLGAWEVLLNLLVGA